MTHPTPKPVLTTVPIRGLKKEYKILHITDLHASEFTEAEAGKMSPNRLAYIEIRRTHWAGGRSFVSAEALPMLIDYAKEIKADLILMTGDMLDFPSEANLGLMEACIKASAVPVLYITGNHDWSYADDYHTPNAEALYLPRVEAISACTHHAACHETDEVLVFAVDSSRDCIQRDTLEAYRAAARRAKTEGKTLILALHVPIHAATLVEDATRVWGRELAVGEDALGAGDATTMDFYKTVAVESELSPDVVIAGHVHFDHEDVFPNGVTQYITDIACDGHCRVITLIPQ